MKIRVLKLLVIIGLTISCQASIENAMRPQVEGVQRTPRGLNFPYQYKWGSKQSPTSPREEVIKETPAQQPTVKTNVTEPSSPASFQLEPEDQLLPHSGTQSFPAHQQNKQTRPKSQLISKLFPLVALTAAGTIAYLGFKRAQKS